MIHEITSDNLKTRHYRHGDFIAISDLWIRTGMGDPVRGDDETIVENSIKMGGALLVLEDIIAGIIVGTSWMTFDGRRILLHHFGILPEYQGKGLSKILLKDSLAFVKEKGHQVKLEVHNTNIRAVNLYKKFGFKPLGDFEVYIIRDTEREAGSN
ncbi:MAG TPA: N-acetyltransferase [Bacteroidales bacterium]|nr:N-acetyltransferase [Bacteroidales bacterium]